MPESSSRMFAGRVVATRLVAAGRAVTAREHQAAVRRDARVRGFTLLELLAVLAIVAILGAMVLGAGQRASELGRVARAEAQLAALAAGLESYRLEHGDYPRTADGAVLLQALIGQRDPQGEQVEGRGFLELARFEVLGGADPRAQLIDPWGEPYVYAYGTAPAGGSQAGYVLYSKGPDAAHAENTGTGGWPDARDPRNADNLPAVR